MKVAVYGGASPQEGEEAYEDARRLGFLLGQSGHTVMTGGYIGVMEAASRGANEAGAHVIGSTCKQIEDWRGTRANAWVKEEWKHNTLKERMYALIENCDATVIMPGGVGTLAELAVMWNEEIISSKPERMMVLGGKGWQKTVSQFLKEMSVYIHKHGIGKVNFAADVAQAVNLINRHEENLKKSS